MNKENIDKVIAALEQDRQLEVSHFLMNRFAATIDLDKRGAALENGEIGVDEYHPCNTAMCICGWTNLIRSEEEEPTVKVMNVDLANTDRAATWLGLKPMAGLDLFYIEEEGVNVFSISRFDQRPAEQRYNAAIKVLEILRDTDKVDWPQALRVTGILPTY